MSNKTFYVNTTFVDRFSQVMKRRNINSTKACKVMGVTDRKTIYRYLEGITQPNVTQISKFCKYFKVDANWLLGLTDER